MDVTAVIPTFGRATKLAEAIASVQAQTDAVVETIVVVDGPDPESADVARKAGCRVIENSTRRGAASARNAGIEAATTEWVAFLDDDDRWHEDRIAVTSAYLQAHPDVRAVDAGFWVFGDTDDVEPDMTYLDIAGRSFDLLLERNRGALNTATVRRDLLLDAGGFPDGVVSGEDWLMFLNVARRTEWHTVPQRLAYFRRWSANSGGDAYMAVEGLASILSVWQDPRPAPTHRPLKQYGVMYRHQVQWALWGAIKTARWKDARRAITLGVQLLPRWRDRLYALIPPQVTWRLSRRGAARGARSVRLDPEGRDR